MRSPSCKIERTSPRHKEKTVTDLQFNANIEPFVRKDDRASLEEIQRMHGLERIYKLQNNENPLGPSPRVVEAINAIAPTLSYYPEFSDIKLRRAIVDVLGSQLTPEHIFTGCSGFEVLELISRAFLSSGDEVILCSPTFTGAYSRVILPLGATVVDVPLVPETFEYRVDAVLGAITDKTKLIMICNPNNPTGTVIPAGKIDTLMSGVPDHVLVVADEVYHHFVDDPAFPDSMKYVRQGKNIAIAHSFSKAYGLAGMRLGYGIARPQIANYIAGMHRGFHQNKLALAAGIAACKDQAHLRHVVETMRAEAAWVCAQFDRLDIRYWRPAANFILFETKMLAEALEQRLLERGFLLRGQTRNNMPYRMRISLSIREDNQAFIKALEDILGESSA